MSSILIYGGVYVSRFRVLAFTLIFSLCLSFSSWAVTDSILYDSDGFAKQVDTYKDLSLSASNAIRYKSWDDNISVASSVGTVVNTVKWGGASAILGFYSTSDKPVKWVNQQITDFDSSYARVKITDLRSHFGLDSSYFLRYFGIRLYSVNLPVAGTYDFSFDSSSQFTYTVDDIYLDSIKKTSNAADQSGILSPPYSFSGGDFYISPYKLGLTNVYFLTVFQRLSDKTLNNLDVVFHARFVPSIGTPSGSTVGTDTSSQDTQNTIANATSQIASSVNDVYDSIHDLMQHISNQLAALWDQMYNYMHVPTYNKLQEILQAIQAIQLKVNVDVSSVVDAVDNSADRITDSVNSSINNQITNDNKNADDIKNGYDNSGMKADNDRLNDKISQYDNVEDQLFDDAKNKIGNFTFENPLTKYTDVLSDISYFLSGIYTALGALNIPVGFSLTLTIALIFIGYYRFKGGS